MNRETELFLEQWQERLLDLHSKLEDKIDVLSVELANNENLSQEEREKLDQQVFDVYSALGNLRLEII